MSFKNLWMISSSNDFQAHQQHSPTRCCFPQTALQWFKVLSGMSLAPPAARRLSIGAPRLVIGTPRPVVSAPKLVVHAPRLDDGTPSFVAGASRFSQAYINHSHSTSLPVIKDPSYSKGRPGCDAWVWYSPEIDASKFTHYILSDTPGSFQWLEYILLMSVLMPA